MLALGRCARVHFTLRSIIFFGHFIFFLISERKQNTIDVVKQPHQHQHLQHQQRRQHQHNRSNMNKTTKPARHDETTMCMRGLQFCCKLRIKRGKAQDYQRCELMRL